jgi:hypothetical protein
LPNRSIDGHCRLRGEMFVLHVRHNADDPPEVAFQRLRRKNRG